MRIFRMLYMILFLIMTAVLQAAGQGTSPDSVQNQLPENLRSGKALMLIEPLPDPEDSRLRGEWMPIAEKAQPYMKLAGIDVVAAYHKDDILSGTETEKAFLRTFDERNITHLVIIKREESVYRVSVTEFDKTNLIATDKPVWTASAPDLTTVLNQLYRTCANSGQELKNLLILENAIPGILISPINGRRSEFYDLNLQGDQLAVLPFADTAEIGQVMKFYPYKYDFVDPEDSEREIRSEGFQFILHYVHTTGESVRELLGYETGEDAYVSASVSNGEPYEVSYDKDLPVYKFYIKHIYSGNVFLGRSYDAAPTWQEALTLYIANLRKELMGN